MLTVSTPDPYNGGMARSKSPGRKPARRYHHGNLRRALLDEALATIASEGVVGLTLREIGSRLGVSRTALYRHFADKRALLEAVATEGFRSFREQLVAAWEDGGRGPAGFDAMGVAYVRFAVASPAHYRVMFGGFVDHETRLPELDTEAAGALQVLVDALIALQRDGLVRDDDPVTMAMFVWAVVHGVAMLAIDGQLHDHVGIDKLTHYAVGRLRIAVAADSDRWPALAHA
jgi:AcrR family transcriptional regulator